MTFEAELVEQRLLHHRPLAHHRLNLPSKETESGLQTASNSDFFNTIDPFTTFPIRRTNDRFRSQDRPRTLFIVQIAGGRLRHYSWPSTEIRLVRITNSNWMWREALSDKRKSDPERRAAAIPIFLPYLPIVRLDNGARDGQPHAHAFRLGGEKRFEDLF